MPIILVFGKLRQEEWEFEACLGCLSKKEKKEKKTYLFFFACLFWAISNMPDWLK
jgi:hypothetical protein